MGKERTARWEGKCSLCTLAPQPPPSEKLRRWPSEHARDSSGSTPPSFPQNDNKRPALAGLFVSWGRAHMARRKSMCRLRTLAPQPLRLESGVRGLRRTPEILRAPHHLASPPSPQNDNTSDRPPSE